MCKNIKKLQELHFHHENLYDLPASLEWVFKFVCFIDASVPEAESIFLAIGALRR